MFIKSLLLLVSTVMVWSGLAVAEITFVHPGAIDSRASLDFVKARIAAGEQPWKREFNMIRGSTAATRGPSSLTHIFDHHDAGVARDDALAAYTQALLWEFTGDDIYAKRSVDILNTWSGFQGFTLGTDQDKLRAGWIGAVFAPAAEIMRGYSEWKAPNTGELIKQQIRTDSVRAAWNLVYETLTHAGLPAAMGSK